MPKFRKKPVVIEARKFDLVIGGWGELVEWMNEGLPPLANAKARCDAGVIYIRTLEG